MIFVMDTFLYSLQKKINLIVRIFLARKSRTLNHHRGYNKLNLIFIVVTQYIPKHKNDSQIQKF